MKISTPIKVVELTFAAPFVIAQRLTHLATEGSHTARSNQEVYGMWSEKVLAFSRSQNAMWLEGMRYQQNLALSITNYWMNFLWNPRVNWQTPLRQYQKAAERTFSKGLMPIHSKAVANARRLSKAR